MPTTTTATPDRAIRCRYLRGTGAFAERCTGEVAEEGAEVELCLEHLAAAWQLVRRRMANQE
ncbi:hypothetical protein ABGB07_03815 [Micromonosporaceae bacterium B7E4]